MGLPPLRWVAEEDLIYDSATNTGEIGDICAWKTKTIGQYTVQLEWSNKNKSCM